MQETRDEVAAKAGLLRRNASPIAAAAGVLAALMLIRRRRTEITSSRSK